MRAVQSDKIGVFIEGINFYSTTLELNLQVDYIKLLNWVSKFGNLVRASYYITYKEDEDGYSSAATIMDFLEFNGYTVVSKPTRIYTKDGEKRVKASVGVDIAVDAMEATSWMDHAFIFSGDGDFIPLVCALQRKGIKVTVVSSIKTNLPMVSDKLRRQADFFVDLKDIESILEREKSDIKDVTFMKKEEKK